MDISPFYKRQPFANAAAWVVNVWCHVRHTYIQLLNQRGRLFYLVEEVNCDRLICCLERNCWNNPENTGIDYWPACQSKHQNLPSLLTLNLFLALIFLQVDLTSSVCHKVKTLQNRAIYYHPAQLIDKSPSFSFQISLYLVQFLFSSLK